MLKLALYSVVPFGLLAAASGAISGYAEKLSNDAVPERLGFFVQATGTLAIVAVALFVRLWFDLAQAQVVRDNEYAVLRLLPRSLKFAFRSGKLFARYLAIALFSIAAFGVGVSVWWYLPHSAIAANLLVLELVTVTQIASRLWLKAASARWVALQTLPSNPGTELAAPVIQATVTGSLPE
jgi:hypothetical protein